MRGKLALRTVFTLSLFVLLLTNCAAPSPDLPQTQLRGIWVQGDSIKTKDGIDLAIQKARAGGFKQIFVGVFGGGTTVYPSLVTLQKEDVEAGLDPLAYIVQTAHSQGIEVHAWFAVGRVADSKGWSVVIENHPDWGLVGPDGKTMSWLNFTNPEARQFISDVMMEAVERGVDGVHFDYTRYPDSEWGFDDYSIELFNQQHEYDLNELRYNDLPAYGPFEGNALLIPSTAKVLARFSNGFPAVMLNHYGDGQVLILNWQAGERKTAVGSEILKRGIGRFLQDGKEIYILRSEINIAEYGEGTVTSIARWLHDLGWDAAEVSPNEVGWLEAGSVLVLPYVYLFSESDAEHLAQFVSSGGSAIFIDSPTPSMNLSDMRAVTGMEPLRKYFKGWLLMTSNGEDSFIPSSDRVTDIGFYKKRNDDWVKFRMAGIDTLIRDVYQRIKAERPDVLVTVTITSDQEQAAKENMQDWKAWLEGRYIDALIPRVYEDKLEEVNGVLDSWSSDVAKYGRMTFGVITFTEAGSDDVPKPPTQVIREVELVLGGGSNGFMVFDLDRITDEQLKALADLSLPASKVE